MLYVLTQCTQETNSRGITSAVLFNSPSTKPYVLCTTSPSNERAVNQGEWSFISPIGSSPAVVPQKLEHSFSSLGKAKGILAGAASTSGKVIALLDEQGFLRIFRLAGIPTGGLCSLGNPVILDHRLSKQQRLSTAAIRFQECDASLRLELFAIDIQGVVIRKVF